MEVSKSKYARETWSNPPGSEKGRPRRIGRFPLEHVRIGARDRPSSPGVDPSQSQPIDDSWEIWMGPLLPALAETVDVSDEPFVNRDGLATLVEQRREFRTLSRIASDGGVVRRSARTGCASRPSALRYDFPRCEERAPDVQAFRFDIRR